MTETPQGTRRIYRLDPRGIAAMRDWLEQTWARALIDFKTFAEETENHEKQEKEK